MDWIEIIQEFEETHPPPQTILGLADDSRHEMSSQRS